MGWPASTPNSGGADGAEHLGGLEQLLGGDAAAVQAGAADPGLFDHGDAQPGRGAVERGGVATGTAAQDDDVELLSHRAHHLLVGALRPSLCAQANGVLHRNRPLRTRP